jgi:signal transduction histidine kinase
MQPGCRRAIDERDATMTFLQRIDPRLHLAAAIGWTVVAVTVVSALLAALLAANLAERHVRSDVERLLTQFASQISDALATNLTTRRLIMQASATQIMAANDRGTDALRAHLDAVQAQFPEFSWLGVADDRGRVVASTGAVLLGANIAERPWFRHGQTASFFGEAHDGALLQGGAAGQAGAPPPRLVDIAVPLVHADGRHVGVLGGHLSWTWLERLQAGLLAALDTRRQLDVLIVAGDGTVLAGPDAWLGRKLVAGTDLTEGGTHLTGRDTLSGQDGLHWTVVVRQRAATALAPAYLTHRTVFLVVLLAGLTAAGAAALLTRLLTGRLSSLAEQARAIGRGRQAALAVPAGRDEVSRIGAVLAEVIDSLQAEKRALATLNDELETRVAERSARIERLADEARQAAVTRERLRLARDLHDTLAHSLMTLLTQIRLVRKLRDKLNAEELDEELGRAESVAASGMAEARAAITQMRHNGVRDVGLGAALSELLARFRERCGVATQLWAAPTVAGLAGDHAETVFRIVEEALHNVERHAQAREVSVRLADLGAPLDAASGAGLRVAVEIVDDGKGFDPEQPRPGHYGLRGIEEQAALIGARFDIVSGAGQGCRLRLVFDT